jgi:c-di-GMP-related signal transduction protein
MLSILENVPVDHETKAVLLGGGGKLQPIYQLMLARESGDWQGTAEHAQKLGLGESEIAEAYWQAMQWVRQLTSV